MYEVESCKRRISLNITIHLAFQILQTAKLWLLRFYYEFLDVFVSRKNFEMILCDTDSAYFSVSGTDLDSSILSSKRVEYEEMVYGRCYDFTDESRDPVQWVPRQCCTPHEQYSKRQRGVFKLEFSGNKIIALNSKTYHISRGSKEKFSCKSINKRCLKAQRPIIASIFEEALFEKKVGSIVNKGFRAHNLGIYTYEQSRIGFSYLYIKRHVMDDGINTKPLMMTLRPRPEYHSFTIAPYNPLSNEYLIELSKHDETFKNVWHLYFYEMAIFHELLVLADHI